MKVIIINKLKRLLTIKLLVCFKIRRRRIRYFWMFTQLHSSFCDVFLLLFVCIWSKIPKIFMVEEVFDINANGNSEFLHNILLLNFILTF